MTGLGQHLALIGYRASGKTSIGIRLSEHFRCPWIDLDAFLEESCGRQIPDIFDQNGEAYFRDLESDCLKEICAKSEPVVLSTGGGVILREENRALLRKTCEQVIYLEADAAVLSDRLSRDGGDRPSLTGASIEDEVSAVLEQRRELYRETATQSVDANRDFEAVVQHIIKIVEN